MFHRGKTAMLHHNENADSQYVLVSPGDALEEAESVFKEWALAAKKVYSGRVEYAERFEAWLENLAYVIDYNGNSPARSHWLGMNAFADMRFSEWQQVMGLESAKFDNKFKRSRTKSFKYDNIDVAKLPNHVDWTKNGAVGSVKAQGMCGSCWAFSTTGAIEGINAITTGEFVSLSEQMLIDCDTSRDSGCDGGLMDFAFDFVHENGGIDTEASYPYLEKEGQCDMNRMKRHVVTIDGYEDVPEDDELALKKAVAHQPVSVAIEADQRAFQLYVGGVFDDLTCGTDLNHGVLVVGYGTSKVNGSDMAYWKVKNSWGDQWGEGGFIKLARTIGMDEGECGVAKMASYPLKNGPNPPEPPPAPPLPPPPPPEPVPVDCDPTTACPPVSYTHLRAHET